MGHPAACEPAAEHARWFCLDQCALRYVPRSTGRGKNRLRPHRGVPECVATRRAPKRTSRMKVKPLARSPRTTRLIQFFATFAVLAIAAVSSFAGPAGGDLEKQKPHWKIDHIPPAPVLSP